MTEPRKPIFGFLWPRPDPSAPVDGAVHQVRPIRVSPRGPIRLVVLFVGTVFTVLFIATSVMAAVVAPYPPAVIVSAVIGATACFLILRGWVVGTFVSDQALRVETVLSRAEVPWSRVATMDTRASAGPFLGLPLPVSGHRVFATLEDGTRVGTHVYTGSPDLWLRPEAFDVARLRLENWSAT